MQRVEYQNYKANKLNKREEAPEKIMDLDDLQQTYYLILLFGFGFVYEMYLYSCACIYNIYINSTFEKMETNNLTDIEISIANKYVSTDLISQLTYIRSQQEILEDIKKIIQKRHYVDGEILSMNGIRINNNPTNFLDQSFSSCKEQQSSLPTLLNSSQWTNNILGNELEDIAKKSKFRQEMEISSMTTILKEIERNCSSEVYQLTKKHFVSSRGKEITNLQKIVAKVKDEKDELASQILILKIEKTNLEREVERYKKIVIQIDQEKKKIKNKIDYVLKKQNQISKLQTSLTFKEKINLELKKRYERLAGIYLTNELKMDKMFEHLDHIWDTIMKRMNDSNCTGGCWRKEILKRAKDCLLQERRFLRDQSLLIDRQYEIMTAVSEQFKRIFQQSEDRQSSKQVVENSSPVKKVSQIKYIQIPKLPMNILKQ